MAAADAKRVTRHWTEEEDAAVLRHVAAHGPENWVRAAQPQHSAYHYCNREQYLRCVLPFAHRR